MIDKRNIKEILEGQSGQEVADNLRDNFYFLADEIDKGGGGAGVADDELLPSSNNPVKNKVLYAKFESIEQSINDLLVGNVEFSFSVFPSSIFVGENKSITLNASITGGKGQIVLKKGGSVIKTSEPNVSNLVFTDNVIGVSGDVETYNATATVMGKTFPLSKTVKGYYHTYVGVGNSISEILVPKYQSKVAKDNVKGSYTFAVTKGQKLFIAIPNGMTLNTSEIYMGKNPLYVHPNGNTSHDGTTYNIYDTEPFSDSFTLELKIG